MSRCPAESGGILVMNLALEDAAVPGSFGRDGRAGWGAVAEAAPRGQAESGRPVIRSMAMPSRI
jgi:hypothetical protein